jgi:hypothetical protein
MSHRVDVTTSDLDMLKDKLSGILTSDSFFVSTLIRNKYPDEALKILSAFNQARILPPINQQRFFLTIHRASSAPFW